MKFLSRKDPLIVVLIIAIIVFLNTVVFFNDLVGAKEPPGEVYIISLATNLLLLSTLFFTFYTLKNKRLHFVCGPFFGNINIDAITEIIVGKTLWVGMRPATARNGLIVKYKGGIWGEIYISPKTNESFVEEILKQNPKIKITK